MKHALILTALLLVAATAAAGSPNACEVLDVEAVEKKHTTSAFDGVAISQCFYRMAQFSDSISVDVIRPESSTMTAHDLWQKITGKRIEKMGTKGRDAGKTLEGLGDTAIWAGNNNAGALYVLRGQSILRISVGGAGTEEQKIEKTRKLAEAALAKM